MSSSFYPSRGSSWLQPPTHDGHTRFRRRRIPTAGIEVAAIAVALMYVAYSLL